MKNLLQIFLCWLLSLQIIHAQKNVPSFRIGTHFQTNFIVSDNPNYDFSTNGGLLLEADYGKKWTPAFMLSHHRAHYQTEETGIKFGDPATPIHGINYDVSTLVSDVKEYGINFSLVFNRKIKIKKLNPFIGLGVDVQVPIFARGSRYILYPSGTKEQLTKQVLNLS